MKDYFQHYGSTLQEQARELRDNLTEPERKLWFCFLKAQEPKFSCQKVVGPYILDFFCPDRLLAVELDGESHTETVEHDRMREKYLNEHGITVLHFTNQDVMKRFESVCTAILQVLEHPRAPFEGAPRSGGGCTDTQFSRQNGTITTLQHPPASASLRQPPQRGHKGAGQVII